MGQYEDQLKRLAATPDWEVPKLAELSITLEVLRGAVERFSRTDAWKGTAATEAGSKLTTFSGQLRTIRDELANVRTTITAANAAKSHAVQAAGDLPSADIDPFWENVAKAGSVVVHPVLGPLAADTAIDAIEGWLGGNRDDEARKAVEHLQESSSRHADTLGVSMKNLADATPVPGDAKWKIEVPDPDPKTPIGTDPGWNGPSYQPGPGAPSPRYTGPSVDGSLAGTMPTSPGTGGFDPVRPNLPTSPGGINGPGSGVPTVPGGPGPGVPTVPGGSGSGVPTVPGGSGSGVPTVPGGSGSGMPTVPGGTLPGSGSGGSGLLGGIGGGAAGAAALAVGAKVAGAGGMRLGGVGGAGAVGTGAGTAGAGGSRGIGAGSAGGVGSAGARGTGGLVGRGGALEAGTTGSGAAGSNGAGGSGAAGARGGTGMMAGGGGQGAAGSERERRSGLGGAIAPKLEDEGDAAPRSRGAGAGGRDE